MSPEQTQLYGPHNIKRVNKEIILTYTLQEDDQFLCNISLRFIVPCFSMVMNCTIIQDVKGLTKKLYTAQEEDTQYFTQVHYSHYFTRL